MREVRIAGTLLTLLRGDITEQEVGAIVNAANERLAGGGGVDGAIHRAGGPAIGRACAEIRERQGGCPTGEAVITPGGKLPVKFVIHTVGPVWSGGNRGEPELLERCYRNCLRIAEETGIRTVAFPSISTGAYRFPVDRAADIAIRTVIDELKRRTIDEARFVLFSDADLETYITVLDEVSRNR